MRDDDDGEAAWGAAVPASDLEAERWVLAAMMAAPGAIEDAAAVLDPDDFYRPGHGDLFLAMIGMYGAGEPVTPVTLRAWMETRDMTGSLRQHWPGYLLDLFGLPAVPSQVTYHADLVWDCAVRRKVTEAGTRLQQLAARRDADPADLISEALGHLEALSEGSVRGDQALTTEQFLALPAAFTKPVIPGMLWQQERAVLVSIEGIGKTMLAHQAAYALAAGTHPFYEERIPAGKVLIIDLENPLGLLQPRLSGLRDVARGYPGWREGNVALYARPGGVDLTRPAVAFKVADLIRRQRPLLVVAGPVYKMFEEGERDGWKHAAICRFFDRMRERYGVSVWLETHVPISQAGGKRDMRPLGSGIWSRWPEYGVSLHTTSRKDKSLDVGRFRGDRGAGLWPDKLRRRDRLTDGPGWPWIATYPEGTFTGKLGEEAG